MAFTSARLWKRWVIIIGVFFYVFIVILRQIPMEDVSTAARHDNSLQDVLQRKARSGYQIRDNAAIRTGDYGNVGKVQRMEKRKDYQRLARRIGVLITSQQSDKISPNNAALSTRDKRYNIRALLAPSNGEPLAFVARNNTLAAIFPKGVVKHESEVLKPAEDKGLDKSQHDGQIENNDLSGDNGESQKLQTKSDKEKFGEYSSRKAANHTHRFHITPDPLCLRYKPNPSCRHNNVTECNARIISCQPYLCSSQEEDSAIPYLVVIIPSHPRNRYRREAIRDTWGALARPTITYHGQQQRVTFVFLLGGSSSAEEEHQVAREHALYRDIVQYDIKDRYDLLSIKSVLMLDWIKHFCKRARYFLKTDDDVFLNISNLIRVLQKESHNDVLIGSLHTNSEVQRNGQWKVGLEIYPSPTYPPYCSGTAYVMSQDVARDLYRSHYSLRNTLASTGGTPVPMEDVYITGVLAQNAGRACRDSKVFPNWTTGPSPRTLEAFLQGKVLGIHGLSSYGIYGLERVVKKCPQCAGNRTMLQQWYPLLTGAS